MKVVSFSPEFERKVIDLIVGIQQGEFEIEITEEQQPDLHAIPTFYQTGAGNFWLAIVDDQLIGTVSLLDIGNGQAALRKMFVHPDFRGPEPGTALELLRTLLAWSADRGVREIFLGTTPFFKAAHRFYEKHRFTQIPASRLPAAFPMMEVDTRFYRFEVLGRDESG